MRQAEIYKITNPIDNIYKQSFKTLLVMHDKNKDILKHDKV